MSEVKGGGRVMPSPISITDEYLAELLRVQREILDILKSKGVNFTQAPESTDRVKEPEVAAPKAVKEPAKKKG